MSGARSLLCGVVVLIALWALTAGSAPGAGVDGDTFPPPNSNGWYNFSPVQGVVNFEIDGPAATPWTSSSYDERLFSISCTPNASDVSLPPLLPATSGVAGVAYTVSGETTALGTTVTCTASYEHQAYSCTLFCVPSGFWSFSSAVQSVKTFKIDLTRPTITVAPTTMPNANGWYNHDVVMHYTCTDALSGIPAGNCPADVILSAEGDAVQAPGKVVDDAAGNTSFASNFLTVKIDKTPPTVQVLDGPPPATSNDITTVGGICSPGDLPYMEVDVTLAQPGKGPVTLYTIPTSCSFAGTWAVNFVPALSTQGTYGFTAHQWDLAGNEGTGSLTSTLNKVGPPVSVTQVNGAAAGFPFTSTQNVGSVGGTCGSGPGDAPTVSVTVNGSPASPATAACSNGMWQLNLASSLTTAVDPYVVVVSQIRTGATGSSAPAAITVLAPLAPGALCTLTTNAVIDSAAYQAASPAQQLAGTGHLTKACNKLGSIGGGVGKAKKEKLREAYEAQVDALQAEGFLTTDEAANLDALAADL